MDIQHKLYPYYETGIQEIDGKNYLYSRPLIPEAKTKYPSRIKGTFKIADEELAKTYSWGEMARRAYISQTPVKLLLKDVRFPDVLWTHISGSCIHK